MICRWMLMCLVASAECSVESSVGPTRIGGRGEAASAPWSFQRIRGAQARKAKETGMEILCEVVGAVLHAIAGALLEAVSDDGENLLKDLNAIRKGKRRPAYRIEKYVDRKSTRLNSS